MPLGPRLRCSSYPQVPASASPGGAGWGIGATGASLAWAGRDLPGESSLTLAGSRGPSLLSRPAELPLNWALAPVWLCGEFRTYIHTPNRPFPGYRT